VNERVFRAMADPTRRRILLLLRRREMTAGEIGGHFSLAQPTVSRHLALLSEAGLVRRERRGRHVVYRLEATVLQSWLVWLLETFGDGGRRA
jgi:ArsR family transcriptional regulator